MNPRIKEAIESIAEGVDIPFTTDQAAWDKTCFEWKLRSAKAIDGLRALELDTDHVLAIKDDVLRDLSSLRAEAALEVHP